VPADMIFLRTTEKPGACFIRTDQLDGETDWKLKLAVQNTQTLQSNVVCLKNIETARSSSYTRCFPFNTLRNSMSLGYFGCLRSRSWDTLEV